MRQTIPITMQLDVPLTIDQAAEYFCNLDDEGQADFFDAVAKKAESWPAHAGAQWHLVRKRLEGPGYEKALDIIGWLAGVDQ